jgi:hypothetical protein
MSSLIAFLNSGKGERYSNTRHRWQWKLTQQQRCIPYFLTASRPSCFSVGILARFRVWRPVQLDCLSCKTIGWSGSA